MLKRLPILFAILFFVNLASRSQQFFFTSYPIEKGAVAKCWIYSIDEDAQGNLWIGTKGGLNQWLSREKRFRRLKYSTGYTNDVTDYPYDGRVARNGSILINTPPVLTIYHPAGNTYRHYTSRLAYDGSVKDNRIPLLEDRDRDRTGKHFEDFPPR